MINIPSTPTLHHKSPILRDGFVSIMVIGKSGCGKTNFIVSLIPHLSDDIDTYIVASVIRDAPAHKSIVEYCQNQGHIAGTCNSPDELRQAIIKCKDEGFVTPARQGMIIFDDFNIGCPRGEFWDATIDAFTKGRNNGWNFIIIAQYPTFIPPIIRNNTTCRVLFDCYSDYAGAAFLKDIRTRLPDIDAYHTLVKYTQSVPYTYIMVQDRPFTLAAGSLDKAKIVMDERSVKIPTMNEIMSELKVKTPEELDKKTAYLQAKAGNTSYNLLRPYINSSTKY